MRFSPAFLIAASAVLFTVTEASPMHRNQRGRGTPSNAARERTHQPPVEAFYNAPLPESPPRGQDHNAARGGRPLRDLRRRPRQEESIENAWYTSLARPNPHSNQYGSPNTSPQRQPGNAHAGPSYTHQETDYSSSAPLGSPMYVAKPINPNSPRAKAVKPEDVPYAVEHPDYVTESD